jgi:PAS domain S-box-containing protein
VFLNLTVLYLNRVLVLILSLLVSTNLLAETNDVKLNSLNISFDESILLFSVAFIFIILIIYFYRKPSSLDTKIILKSQQVISQNKIEEIRSYTLFIAIIAPFSEFFIYYFELRKNNELIPNLVAGLLLLILYIFSKKTNFLRKNLLVIFSSFYCIFFVSTISKILTQDIELITYSEYLILLFFSYYIFFKNYLYKIFLFIILSLLVCLYFIPTINIQQAVLFSVISLIIIILNHLRQIISFQNQEKLLFSDAIVNEGISLVIASQLDGKVTYISENVISILGYTPNELLGNGWWEYTIDATTEKENEKEKIINKLDKEEINTRLIKTKNGEYKWIQWHDKKFGNNLVVGIGQDITELKKLENEKNQRQQKLINQKNILTEISKIQYSENTELTSVIDKILMIASDGLDLDIISLSEYNHFKTNLRVISMYNRTKNDLSHGESFDLSQYPFYLKTILSGKNIIADNVNTNEYTQEFLDGYIKKNGLKSLIDIPIFINGKLKFIMSCETIQNYKSWDNDDINFIKSITDFISLSIENQRRKSAENKVIESENIFRQINETIDNVFWLYDIEKNKVVYISPSCERILGADQTNFYEKFDYWTKYVLEEDKPYILQNHKKILKQGFYEIEYRINKNGQIRWIKEKSYAIQNDDGRVIKSSGICSDITNEKVAQNELKRLSLIAENTTNGISISNIDGEVFWVNQGYLDLFEITRNDIIGKKPREIFLDEDDETLVEKFNQLNGTNYKFEFKAQTLTGKQIWVEINNTIVLDNKGEFVQQIEVLTDITDRVLSKQKIENQSLVLEEYTKDLEYQNTLKEKLIHADTIEDVCYNALTFIEDQFDSMHQSIIFPDINDTYYNGFTLYEGKLNDELIYATELFCLDKCKNGEIYLKENLNHDIESISESDKIYIEKGIKSYVVTPLQFNDEFLGLLIIGFDQTLELSFKQITYLKEASSVIGVTINQLQLKEKLQTKNHDILSSIIYAKNIQESALPDLKSFSKNFQNVSLFYRPKDIVSGDFYWGKETEEFTIIALGDCTGHGVPGAFLTLLGINILEQLIGVEKKSSPADILMELDQRLYQALNRNKQDSIINDGMELGICMYHKLTKKVLYCGAGLGILYFYNNEEIHVRGHLTTIGDERTEKYIFSDTEIPVTGREYFYMATDGYQDQLGGIRYKRFSKNKLISLLNDIKFKEPEDQELILAKNIDEYIGNYDQLDDFTVLGFTINPNLEEES